MSTVRPTHRNGPRPLSLCIAPNPLTSKTHTSPAPTPSSAGLNNPLSAPADRPGSYFDPSLRNTRRHSSISYGTNFPRASRPGPSKEVERRRTVAVEPHSGRDAASTTPRQRSTEESTESLTLAERHADLLRFIAQKEAKCLELRTQLAQHEADLTVLKRKWERIVSKDSPTPGHHTPSTDVLEGIREGVQSGLGKVLAVLEPMPPPASRKLPSIAGLASTQDTPNPKRASIASSAASFSSSPSSLFDVDGKDTDHSRSPSTATSVDGRHTADGVDDIDELDVHWGSPSTSSQTAPQPRTFPLSTSLDPLASTPLASQLASWTPPGLTPKNLNKKWEELRDSRAGTTISKQSKRASVLLNDMFTALASPGPQSSYPPSPAMLAADATFLAPMAAMGMRRGPQTTTPTSLLDSEDDGALPPSAQDPLLPEVKHSLKPMVITEDDSSDEWNW